MVSSLYNEMNYNEKVDYLLDKLGFEQGEFLNEYRIYIENYSQFHRNVRAVDGQTNKETTRGRKVICPVGYIHVGGKCVPEFYELLNFLEDEFNFKRKFPPEWKNEILEYVTATDLSNFAYCPAAYSIGSSASFPKLASSELGSDLHEQNRLLYYLQLKEGVSIDFMRSGEDWDYAGIYNAENGEFFNDVNMSNLIYIGHSEKSVQSFENKNLNFKGKPDYVFENSKKEIFIVEEKFFNEYYMNFNTFYKNHSIQLLSYLYYLDELKASYGYLLYWKYELDYSGEFMITNCYVKKIIKDINNKKVLFSIAQNVRELRKKKSLEFDISNLSPKKCAHCVYCMFCNHKTGKKKQLELPYTFELLP